MDQLIKDIDERFAELEKIREKTVGILQAASSKMLLANPESWKEMEYSAIVIEYITAAVYPIVSEEIEESMQKFFDVCVDFSWEMLEEAVFLCALKEKSDADFLLMILRQKYLWEHRND